MLWSVKTAWQLPNVIVFICNVRISFKEHEGLFTPKTMESSQGLIKSVIGCWIRPGMTLVYTKEKMSEWPWSWRFSKDMFKDLHYSLTWSNRFCGGRDRRGAMVEKNKGPMVEKYCYNKNLMNFFSQGEQKMKYREEKRGGGSNLNFSFKFFDIFKKNHFWCMVIPLGPHSIDT